MKKLIAIILIAALITAFAACRKVDPNQTPSESATPEPDAILVVNVGKFANMLEPEMKAVTESMGGSMNVRAYSYGADLIIEYQFLTKEDTDPEELERSVSAQSDVFYDMFEELSSFAGSQDVRIILRYLKKNGDKILDYVIDKNNASEESGNKLKYDSLEELIRSGEFLSSIQGGDQEGMIETTAFIENVSDVVILQKYLEDMTEADREAFKTAWDESMASNGDNAAQTLVNSIKSAVDVDRVGIIYRVVDKNGSLITEYRANVH